ncbi:hypothetical protein GGP41_010168 [Bipolaris sorokiniana]|uniref:Uncharacterized protein n=2 Tax=Cochliobolus sativus TaxID=45130 RepID=A0A8H6DQI9_COCSA|nr:hypothetical protein GGP41_010168 [Bipolaris sorokiniana]
MDRMNYKTCTIAEYMDYQLKREKLWENAGIYIRSFHWADPARMFVCRCAERTCYKYSMLKDPVQMEQCAEYFLLHRDEITASQEKWERHDEDLPPPYAPNAQSELKYSRQQYQRPTQNEHTSKPSQRIPKPEMGMRGSAEPLTPRFVEPRKDGAAMQQESEMPPQVWRHARPSLWKYSDGNSSSASTPLGSSFYAPSEEPRVPATAPLENRPAPWNGSDSGYSSTQKHQGQRDARAEGIHSRSKSYELDHDRADSSFDMHSMHSGIGTIPISKSSTSSSQSSSKLKPTMSIPDAPEQENDADSYTPTIDLYFRIADEDETNISSVYRQSNPPSTASSQNLPFFYENYLSDNSHKEAVQKDVAELSPEAYYYGDRYAIPTGHDNQNKGSSGHISELSAETPAAELSADAPRQRHTPTLNALEGRDWGTIPEMEAKTSDSNDKGEKVPVWMSSRTYNSGLIDSLLEQVSHLGSSMALDQDGQLRCPTDSTSGISGSFQHFEEPSQTLRCVFQSNLTLAERIGQDIRAIFGTQCTPLKEETVIEFPHRSDTFKCLSEEELAVTQLALIKDHVGINAEEVFSRWNTDVAAPNWNANVIQPAVKLFMGWNRSFRTLFSMSQEAFLRVVAWGELVRLMNQSWTVMQCQPGEKVMFAQLGQVHRQFFKAKVNYDKEKKDRKISRFEALGCDMIAAYLVTMTIEIGRST